MRLAILALCAVAWAAETTSVHCRVVDLGGDLGDGLYRDHASKEVAKDGTTVISGWAWDESRPLSPSPPGYRAEVPSSLFFGGVVGFQSKGLITEGMINANHGLRDDFNVMSTQSMEGRKPGFNVRVYATILWPKQGFLNGGDAHRVSFDARTRLAVHISRYWDDIDGLRYVVRDRAGLWMSEQVFGADLAGKKQFSPVLDPSATRWAAYTPAAPAAIAFDATRATFAARAFDDVQAVGFHLFRDRTGPGVVAVKWNAFALHATVHRPERAGWLVDLRPAGTLQAQDREVSFALWRRIHAWSARNQWCWDLEDGGYTYGTDGEIAGQRDGRPQAAAEPVARIAWIDAIAWCNALSEFEGRIPAYYADAACTQPLRRTCDRDDAKRADWAPQVWLKPAADGYRLPTRAEHLRLRSAGGFDGIADGPAEWLWDVDGDGPAQAASHVPAAGDLPEAGLRVVRGAPDQAPAYVRRQAARPDRVGYGSGGQLPLPARRRQRGIVQRLPHGPHRDLLRPVEQGAHLGRVEQLPLRPPRRPRQRGVGRSVAQALARRTGDHDRLARRGGVVQRAVRDRRPHALLLRGQGADPALPSRQRLAHRHVRPRPGEIAARRGACALGRRRLPSADPRRMECRLPCR